MSKGSPIKRLDFLSNHLQNQEITILKAQNDKLNKIVFSKNLQIKTLLQENKLLQQSHQSQVLRFKALIKDLQFKTSQYQSLRNLEFQNIKDRYLKSNDDTQVLKSYHSHQVQFLLKQITQLRTLASSKDQKIQLKDHQMKTLKESFQRQASELINQINKLKKGVFKLQEDKNKQIRQLSAKRQLQKSRTSGVMTSRKQNNQFIDKQMRKLNEQILQKTIIIQNLNRQLTKQKKKSDDNIRNLNKKIEGILKQKQQQNRQREQYFSRIESSLKKEIIQFKDQQFKLLNEIDTLKNQFQVQSSQIILCKNRVLEKEQQVKDLKLLLEQQRQQHIKQINNLISRKRSSKMGSSRSITSSLKDSNINSGSSSQIQHPTTFPNKFTPNLQTVRQQSPDRKDISKELNQSELTQNANQQQENQLARAIFHYDTLVEELKKSHQAELQLLKHKLKKVQKNLSQKQQQMLDVLTRFSPLVKIHAQQKTLQQDRKQRIQRHWKSDLALLEIMLRKNKIQVFD